MQGNSDNGAVSEPRRQFIKGVAVAAAGPSASAWAGGSDAPEKQEVRIGFMPLTDCAAIVMASVLKFDAKYGIRIVATKEASWAAVRDKLIHGELDAAHLPYGLVYSLHLGLGGLQQDMAVLMALSRNGQGITLSKRLADRGGVDGPGLAALMRSDPREYTFAQTFPTGTHAMWLYYWLAAHGIHPLTDARAVTVPPPQMAAHMRMGRIDGFCVGEPWNHRAVADGIGVTAITTQQIWPDHPEKVLGTTNDFAARHPHTARAMVMAVLEAGRWIDASASHRDKTAQVLAVKAYLNTSVDDIRPRLLGCYHNGLGKAWNDANPVRFFDDGAATFPYLSDGMWFLTQHRRWGLLRHDTDYLAVAGAIHKLDLYKQAAAQVKVSVPTQTMRRSRLIDGTMWDGRNPAQYAAGFALRAL